MTVKEIYAAYVAAATAVNADVLPMHRLRNKAGIAAAIAALPTKAPAKKRTKSDAEFVSLADIARDLHIDPKVIRAKARRYDAKGELEGFERKEGERHVYARHETDRLHELFSSQA